MLKSSNFHAPEIVLIDFGVSRAMVGKPHGLPGGTPGYIPPETLDTSTWFPRGDIFSMGVTIFQVMADKIPPQGARTVATPGGIFVEGCLTIQDIMNATRQREPPWHLLPPTMPGLTQLLKPMLSKQMRNRPTAPKVLKDQWFATESEVKPVVSRSRGKSWATVGITKSFLARPSVSDEEMPAAILALREVQHSLSAENTSAVPLGSLGNRPAATTTTASTGASATLVAAQPSRPVVLRAASAVAAPQSVGLISSAPTAYVQAVRT